MTEPKTIPTRRISFEDSLQAIPKYFAADATYGFLIGMTLATIASLARDRRAWNPIRLGKSLNTLRSSPFLTRESWRTLRAYNRRGFHAEEFDTRVLEDEWRDRLFGVAGELNDHLVNAEAARE